MRKRPTELKMEFIERCLSCEDKKMSTELCTDLWEKKQLAAIKRIRSFKKKDLLEFKKERTYVNSSNVDRVMYDFDTKEMVVRFNDGATYTYENVSEDIFEGIVDGDASPVTSGSNQWGSWTEGVAPSVGAALYQKLIKRGNKGKQGGSFR